MSFLDQMKLPGLIDLSLIFILASNSKGENWTVNVTTGINTTLGSNVTIPCTFTYPTKYHTPNVKVTWKTPVKSPITTFDNNIHAFVYHPIDSYVLEKYRGKTKLTGNKAEGDCSLQIQNIMDNELKIYLRVFGSTEQYSFDRNTVSISVSDQGVTSFAAKPDITGLTQPLPTSETPNGLQSASMYMAIFVPVAVLLIIIFVAGIVCYRRHKRSQSFTREESGYYANFSRASSSQAEREASCKKQENKKLPEVKAIDEPIYINTEAPLGQMDQSMNQMDNVYANVDYTK